MSAVPHVNKHPEESSAVSSRGCQVNLDPEPGATVEPQQLGDQAIAARELQKLGDQAIVARELQRLGDQVCAPTEKNCSVTELLNNGYILR